MSWAIRKRMEYNRDHSPADLGQVKHSTEHEHYSEQDWARHEWEMWESAGCDDIQPEGNIDAMGKGKAMGKGGTMGKANTTFFGACFKCGQQGHSAKFCNQPKGKGKSKGKGTQWKGNGDRPWGQGKANFTG